MRIMYEKQLTKLKGELREMGAFVSEALANCIISLKSGDIALATSVRDNESDIIQLERQIENRSVKLIMKQQPVAGDLKFISQAMKVGSHMGRIGRQISDIAEIVIMMYETEPVPQLDNLEEMSALTVENLRNAVTAYTNEDSELANLVVVKEESIDECFNLVKKDIIEKLRKSDIDSAKLIDLLMISKYLERIADHSERIALTLNYNIEI